MDTTADFTFFGENAGDHLGWSVSFAGDMNNDGYNETLVGAPHYNTLISESPPSALDTGRSYVLQYNPTIPEFSAIIAPVSIMTILFIFNKINNGTIRKKKGRKNEKKV
jgi:hypothetical protein